MNILVVDDVQKNRELIQRFLDRHGYNTLSASSGFDCLDILQNESVDLILMDIRMPGIDGIETARQVKEIFHDTYLPILFVTALSEEDALGQALQIGDDYITKPVNFDVLNSKIIAHLRIRELHNQVNLKNEQLMRHNFRLSREQELMTYFFDQAQSKSLHDESLIKQHINSASAFNGDLFLAVRKPQGGVCALLGDMSGHGLAAAIGTLPVSQIFLKKASSGAFIGDIAREINREIGQLLPVELFFAGILIELSASGTRLQVWNGGMPDALLLNGETGELTNLKSRNLSLGIISDDEFNSEVEMFNISNKHRIYLYSDGVIERTNSKNQMYGSERLEQMILSGGNDVFERILNDLEEFSKGKQQTDDTSFIEISCLPVEGPAANVQDASFTDIGWQLSVTLDSSDLQLKDPVKDIFNLISGETTLEYHKGVLYTVLAEMYSNALEHGILNIHGARKSNAEKFDEYYDDRDKLIEKLQGAKIDISLNYQPKHPGGVVTMRMHHNGDSFDPENIQISDSELHGRGIKLISTLCKSVDYSDDGRCLEVVYEFS